MLDKNLLKKIEDKEKQLNKVCQELYLLNLQGKRVKPLPPKIIVRVLPKEHRTESGLYTPGAVANKPVYEGIVLETFEPYNEEHKTKFENGDEGIVYVPRRCSVKVGDHILFPHWEGQPLSDYFDEKYYRIIPDHCVYGTVDYKGEVNKIKGIKKIMETLSSVTLSGAKSGPGVPDWQPPEKASWFTS
jgi:co-chaperonin GroES (HSP10)